MEEELDLREKICRAFTTDITVAGGAREAVIGNFFLALILIFSTDSGLVVLIVIILFTFSHGYLVYLTKKDTKFFKVFRSHLKFKEYYY